MTTSKMIADSTGKYFIVSTPPEAVRTSVQPSRVRVHWPLVALLTVSFVVVAVGVIAAVVISGK